MDVLLVEDDDLVRECLAEILRGDGMRLRAVGAAGEALAACRDAAPLMVVSDIDLGAGMDGVELARALRGLWPSLPFLFISGRRRPEQSALGPLDWFLPKPFRSASLLGLTRQILSGPAAPRALAPMVPEAEAAGNRQSLRR